MSPMAGTRSRTSSRICSRLTFAFPEGNDVPRPRGTRAKKLRNAIRLVILWAGVYRPPTEPTGTFCWNCDSSHFHIRTGTARVRVLSSCHEPLSRTSSPIELLRSMRQGYCWYLSVSLLVVDFDVSAVAIIIIVCEKHDAKVSHTPRVGANTERCHLQHFNCALSGGVTLCRHPQFSLPCCSSALTRSLEWHRWGFLHKPGKRASFARARFFAN